MKGAPTLWTGEQLKADAATAIIQFRDERLAESADSWAKHYKEARDKFELLFSKLHDLDPSAINHANLSQVCGKDLEVALRYLAGPPFSKDDLKVIANVKSVAPSVLEKNPAELSKVFEVIKRIVDPNRFPGFKAGRALTAEEKESALLASSVLLAAQRIATERRSDGKEEQEMKVKNYLRTLNFTEVAAKKITTIVNGPQPMEFCAECLLGERKADVVVRLHDTRLMALECKVSNSSTNSVKRINNDAAVKAKFWVVAFGTDQIVPAAVLSGVFKVMNLEQAQAQGLSMFWAHDLDKLGTFIESTR